MWTHGGLGKTFQHSLPKFKSKHNNFHIFSVFLYVDTGSHDKPTLAHIHPHTYTIGAKAVENPFVYFESAAYDKIEINLYTRVLSGRG